MDCPSCGQENREGASFCDGCGAAFALACPHCGTELRATAKFCDGCGQAVIEGQASARTPTPTPAPAPPASFADGRYQVQRFLGEGGKKRVYLAHDSRLDRDVAIGVIKTEGLDAEGLTRVRREAQAMGRLGDSPHIVTVFDRGDEGDQPYIVMEHMEGGSLDELLRDGENDRLPLEQTLRIAGQISQALAHAHDRGIIHRDLKPGNIYLSQDGTAKLGDFGFAVALDRSRLTREGMMVGTASYMSPEQAVGGDVTPRSDLYALGCALYEMVAGRPPFLGGDTVGVISQHINTAPVAPIMHNTAIPPALDVLITDLLAKAPEERPESASAVREELQRISELSSEQLAVQPHPTAVSSLAAVPWGQFIGRREELDQLKGALENALSGRGSLVMIVGEPGIGKTRLAEEFGVYARLRGAQLLTGHCYEGEVALPYRPFVEAFRQYVRDRPDAELRGELADGAPEVATLVSELHQRFPDIPDVPPLEPDAERLRLFESVSAFVRNVASATPLVLVLDDIHWADKPSLLMLRHLVRAIAGERVLVVGAYRDVELDRTHPLAEVLATLRREQPYLRVLLRGLPEEDVLALLVAMEPSAEVTEGRQDLAVALHRETEGNPLFIREVLSLLVDEGQLYKEGGVWRARVNISELGIPEGVREVIGRRLSRLSDECNQMLTLASTMTGGFDWELIAAVSSEDEERLLDLLDEALRAQVIQERSHGGAGSYDFTHATIRQTLYGELNIPRRVRLHRQIGETLEQLHADNPEPHLTELAHHFFQAAPGGDVDKAIDYAKRAGDRAFELLAYEEAAGQYDLALQALELEERPDETQRCELLLDLAWPQALSGDFRKAIETYERAAAVARSLRAAEQLARAAIGYRLAWAGIDPFADPRRCIELLEEALQALPTEDSALRAEALSLLANAVARSATLERRQELTQGALGIARRLGDPQALADALGATNNALWGPESVEERLANAEEILQLAAETGLKEIALDGHWRRRIVYAQLGEMERSEQDLDAVVKLAEDLRWPLWAALAIGFRAMHRLFDGRFEEAERLMQQALAQGQRTTESDAPLTVFQAQLVNLRHLQGRLEEIEAALKGLIDQYPHLTVYPCALAFVYSETGREDEARAVFERLAENGFAGLDQDENWLTSIYLLTEVCGFLRDARSAEALYPILLPYATRNIGTGGAFICFGSASRSLGLMAAVMERWDDAERHFEEALEMDEGMAAWPWFAYSQYHYGAMLLRRDGLGDQEKALELLTPALATAQELGMKSIVERTLALKMELQGISSTDVKSSIDAVAAAVQAEQPDLRPHAAPDGTVTLLFSDIVDSAPINERLGDQRWMELLREHNALIREQLQAHDGYEVKTEGDGFMVAFSSARKALQCAIAIQRAFARRNDGAEEPVRVRIGLHTGEPVREEGDFYGQHVTLAARIGTEAQGGEILVSALLRELTESAGDIAFDGSREVELKGLGQQRVFQVGWE